MKDIFDTHNVDELTDLNKILLEYHVDYYMKQEKATENNDDVNQSFSELVEERSLIPRSIVFSSFGKSAKGSS